LQDKITEVVRYGKTTTGNPTSAANSRRKKGKRNTPSSLGFSCGIYKTSTVITPNYTNEAVNIPNAQHPQS
jgi:hypothetical protein